MFERLRQTFTNVTKSFNERDLKDKDIDTVLGDLELALMSSDVAFEVIDIIKSDLKKNLVGSKIDKKKIEKFIRDSLINTVSKILDSTGTVDLFARIDASKEQNKPFLILFVGINGTGKTTSLAKIAHLLQQSKYSLVVAAADTFRAGAIEQIREHTNRLNLKLVAQNYNSDPAAVARDAVLYAKSHKTDCVLIDTAGRMQTSKNLMEQIAKINKVVNPDLKIFVGDSLAGNDTVNQAREFFEHVHFDATILTKSDADVKGGAALSIAKLTSTPVIYIGTGQEYGDLRPFDRDTFLSNIFGSIDVDIPYNDVSSKHEILSTSNTSKPAETLYTEKGSNDYMESSESTPDISQQIESPESTSSTLQTKPTSVANSTLSDNDPFAGIDDVDISRYSDIFDIPPPQDDASAQELADKIRTWIKSGRPDSDVSMSSEQKPKKREVFGFFKR